MASEFPLHSYVVPTYVPTQHPALASQLPASLLSQMSPCSPELPPSPCLLLSHPPLSNIIHWYRNSPSIGQSAKNPFFPKPSRSPGPRRQPVPNSITLSSAPQTRSFCLRQGGTADPIFQKNKRRQFGTGG
ncbi:hypothetical protein LZ30DRAFT_727022 [Colletotrichum cereale]|nr:hypothetical protein LZ30DRAFT_727022 [Colletotrichum cereale]